MSAAGEVERLEGIVEGWRREATDLNKSMASALSRLGGLEDAILARGSAGADIQLILQKLTSIKADDLPRIEESLEKVVNTQADQGKTLADYGTRITLIEVFNRDQVKPAIEQVNNNRLEIAKWVGGGLGGAGGLGLVAALLSKIWGMW